MLSKAPSTLWAFKRLLSSVMANMSHQRTFLPESSQAELTHIGFFLTMSSLMHLQCILGEERSGLDFSIAHYVLDMYKILRPTHLSLVSFVTFGTIVWSFIGVRPHVLTYMSNCFVQFSTFSTLVPPLTDMNFHVFLQQVTSEKLLLAEALKRLVT